MAYSLQTVAAAVHTFAPVAKRRRVKDRVATAVGSAIGEARERAGLTQEQLAARARMDRSYLSDLERGQGAMSVEKLLSLSRALGVPAASIVTRVEAFLTDA